MKTKNLCVMIAGVFIISMPINILADCGSCTKASSSKCCKQKEAKKVEAQCKQKCKAKCVSVCKKKKDDEDIPLSQVPGKIKKIAGKAVKGIKLTEAELEDGVYELEGYVGDQKYEIKISSEGKVVKIEKEDDDDDNENETDD